MTKKIRAAVMVSALTLLGTVGLIDPTRAQEPATAKPADPLVKKRYDSARRVPAYFGQIGLTTEQRASIYGIQSKRTEKIEELEKQIATQKAEMLVECEATLTEVQKKLLDNLRRAASEPTKPAK